MDRRRFLGATAVAGAALMAKPYVGHAAPNHQLLVAEPVHSTAYLPMYLAMAKGYFAEADIEVQIVTIESGAGHTNAVLSGQAFAFIGGPEHCAFAKAKGAELRSVVHCVDRGNMYLMAGTGTEPINSDWGSYLRGKKIAVGPFGGTPNSILRYLLKQWNLDTKKDVTLVETTYSASIATVRSKQAEIGQSFEPFVTQGIRQGVWGDPFYNTPKELGPYANTTINIRLDSIKKEPAVVRGFVRGIMKASKFLYANPTEVIELTKRQFPTMALDDLNATMNRSFADELWSKDGMVSPAAWDTAKAVVMDAGILKTDVKYDEIIDMSFVENLRSTI